MQATKEEISSSLASVQNRVGQVETDLETTQTSFETDIDVNRNTLLSLTSKQFINSLSLSAFPFYLWGQFFTFVAVFLLHLFIIFGVGLPAYLSNHNLFSREHIIVGFNEFPSLVYWCTVIHHHRPQGPTPFRRVRWDFLCVQCNVCTYTGPPVLSPIRED